MANRLPALDDDIDRQARNLQKLPGYPFWPCPICKGVEGCDHAVPERAAALGYDTGDYELH